MESVKELMDEYREEHFFRHLLTAFVVGICAIGTVLSIANIIIAVQLSKLVFLLQCIRGCY